jgi:hypothetical protein
MKILIATPLYPPDIAGHAPYVKELATRLRSMHNVTILAYNHIPEKIDGVTILPVEKNQPLVRRLFQYTHLLLQEAKRADVVYVQNGPSTEFPLSMVAPFVHAPFVLRLGDETALCHAQHEKFHALLLRIALHSTRAIVTHRESSAYTPTYARSIQKKVHDLTRPHARPEILPFSEFPTHLMDTYEASWNAHITELIHLFTI